MEDDIHTVGKGPATKSAEFLEKGGEGSFSIKKFILQILGTLISGFRVCFCNNCIEKSQNKTHFEGGSSEPPPLLEMFRKFIRFGDAIRPY